MTRDMASSGDLGRHIAHCRVRLGLSREQLAERAGMAPGFVQYLEQSACTLNEGTLLRLAAALETTVDELLGGWRDRPPGQGRPPLHPVLDTLEPEECIRLISSGGIGRVAFTGSAGLVVFPVNYSFYKGAIVFRTQEGGPMDQDLRTGVEGLEIGICFEVDHIDEARRGGWSVLVQGPAHHLTPEEVSELSGLRVEPWANGERDVYVRVTPHRTTGRRIYGF